MKYGIALATVWIVFVLMMSLKMRLEGAPLIILIPLVVAGYLLVGIGICAFEWDRLTFRNKWRLACFWLAGMINANVRDWILE